MQLNTLTKTAVTENKFLQGGCFFISIMIMPLNRQKI